MRQANQNILLRTNMGLGIGIGMLLNPFSALLALPGMAVSSLASGIVGGDPYTAAATGIAALPVGFTLAAAAGVTNRRNKFLA